MSYLYNESNLFYDVSRESESKSSFDIALQTKWQAAHDKGIFRYTLNILESKRLPGKYSFLAQLNPDRALNRRTPEIITSLSQPFNPDRFNFTKIKEDEIVFEIKKTNSKIEEEEESKLQCSSVIAINVSPLEYGHSLLLPEVSSCLPQILTLSSLKLAIEIVLLSDSPAIRAGFNSLCGFATVNHLHYHVYYLHHSMLLEHIGVKKLCGACYTFTEYPAQGFAFQLQPDHDIDTLASCVYKLTNYLQTSNIAHNVFITRGQYFEESTVSSTLNTVRVYVWARKHSSVLKNIKGFDPAICELFGHLVVKVEDVYTSLTENIVVDELSSICQEPFMSVLPIVQDLFQQNS